MTNMSTAAPLKCLNVLSPRQRLSPTRLAAGFAGSTAEIATPGQSSSKAPRRRGSLVVQMAASKSKKSRDLDMLKGMLLNDETLLVAGFRFQGLSVRNSESPTLHSDFYSFPRTCWYLPALNRTVHVDKWLVMAARVHNNNATSLFILIAMELCFLLLFLSSLRIPTEPERN